ncbi:hypothetical protein CAPTEDRAFT_207933 [Capitella teleta]|uniref:Uncharacterized protein n=1 Tax=Capitella teleta TaxID=283909 RepID=R7VG71_CAPTE|nr:hypothetical protein CAPTEDRAFT_207933 [Capitella teleta]|eukprot:ELU17619.1 hypothetical protein CAPTEDRAFT_207933 [Capitella teleta]
MEVNGDVSIEQSEQLLDLPDCLDTSSDVKSSCHFLGHSTPKSQTIFFAQIIVIYIAVTCYQVRLSNIKTMFYLVLPSNSSFDFYPDNTVANYTTRLPRDIELSGEWEVGLEEIQYSHNWFSIQTSDAVVFAYSLESESSDGGENDEWHYRKLDPGYYANKGEIVDAMVKELKRSAGPIEFSISGSGDDYVDFSQSWLYVAAKVTKADDTNLDATASIAPVNNWLHSLFSQIDLSFNDTLVTTSNNTYPYRAYIENLLTFGSDAKQSQLTSEMFCSDTVGKFDGTPSQANDGKIKDRTLDANIPPQPLRSDEIHHILYSDEASSPYFHGVFSRDNLPTLTSMPSSFVCNTDDLSGPGEHWVCVFFDCAPIGTYFYPLGLPPVFEVWEKYLKNQSIHGECVDREEWIRMRY